MLVKIRSRERIFFEMRNHALLALALLVPSAFCTADPTTFPQGFTPFTSLDYRTFTDQNGYSLVVGEITTLDGMNNLWNYLSSLPALSGNQHYANQPIELAPGVFFTNVLVPTSDERQGNFGDFGGPIYDPMTGTPGTATQFAAYYDLTPANYKPFSGNIIPMSRLFGIYAFRVGPDVSSVPEPAAFLLLALGMTPLVIRRAVARSELRR
jgi:hypothetical protein